MKAGEVMSTGAATIRPEASLADAARLLTQHRISGLPVVDAGGELVGVITENDFLRRSDGRRPRWFNILLDDGAGRITARELEEVRVQEVMSTPPISVDIETDVEDLVEIMQRHGVKRLPVLAQGKIVGIVSRANLLEALVRRTQK